MEAAEHYACPLYKWIDYPRPVRNSIGMDISYSAGGIGFSVKNYSHNKKLYIILYIEREDGVRENYILEALFVEPFKENFEKWQTKSLPLYLYESPHGKAVNITFSFIIHKDGKAIPSAYEYNYANYLDINRCRIELDDFLKGAKYNTFMERHPLHPALIQMAWQEANNPMVNLEVRSFFTGGNTDSTSHPRHEIHRLIDMVIERKRRDPWGRHYIHIAVFNFDNPHMTDHLIYAKEQGVEIECLGGWEQVSSLDWIESFVDLRHHGIPIYGLVRNIPHDPSGGIASMHTKIINFDGEAAMTASFNLDFHIWGGNRENAIFLYSPHSAIHYENIYQAIKGSPYISPKIDPDSRFNSYYSFASYPSFNGKYYKAEDIIIREIRKSRSSITVVMFDLNHLCGKGDYGERASCIDELINAAWRGVNVKVVLNGIKAEEGDLPPEWDKDYQRPLKEPVKKMLHNGIEISRVYNPWDIYSPLHHKFAIFDEETVMGGSYNWYSVSPLSDEEMLVIRNRELAHEFVKETYVLLNDLRVKKGL